MVFLFCWYDLGPLVPLKGEVTVYTFSLFFDILMGYQ